MSAGKCPMGQSLGVSHGTASTRGSFGTIGTRGTATVQLPPFDHPHRIMAAPSAPELAGL